MRIETYLNAYFATRDRLEQVRLGGKRRMRLVRQERKLEARLIDLAALHEVMEGRYDSLLDLYEGGRKEKVFLWVVVGCQLIFLVGLAVLRVCA